MNRETLQARVVLLQQNVEIQSQQVKSLADNLTVLRGHLAEAQHWLNQCDEAPAPEPTPEPEALPVEGECEVLEAEPCEQE